MIYSSIRQVPKLQYIFLNLYQNQTFNVNIYTKRPMYIF